VGISISFWLNEYKNSVDSDTKEIQVYHNLLTSLNDSEDRLEERKVVFKFDVDILDNLLNLSDFNSYNYKDLLIATTDWRGFGFNQEMYSLLKEDGSIGHIKSVDHKIAIQKFFKSGDGAIKGNLEDDKIIQREILKYLNFNYPELVLNSNLSNSDSKIKLFKKKLKNDLTLRALLQSKQRFMRNKHKVILNYDNLFQQLRLSLREQLNLKSFD
tara:strand:+ start:931 stop:1572 length:642 start_codon:yes stop_codon:yes gene_type:complete